MTSPMDPEANTEAPPPKPKPPDEARLRAFFEDLRRVCRRHDAELSGCDSYEGWLVVAGESITSWEIGSDGPDRFMYEEEGTDDPWRRVKLPPLVSDAERGDAIAAEVENELLRRLDEAMATDEPRIERIITYALHATLGGLRALFGGVPDQGFDALAKRFAQTVVTWSTLHGADQALTDAARCLPPLTWRDCFRGPRYIQHRLRNWLAVERPRVLWQRRRVSEQ